MKKYTSYLTKQRHSTVAQFMGAYAWKDQLVIVMKNIKNGNYVNETYDMKGSTHDRVAKKELLKEFESDRVYRDTDYINKHPRGIVLQPDLYRLLVNTVNEDTNFLREVGTTDYSLLLSIRRLDSPGPVPNQHQAGGHPQVPHDV